MTDNVVPFLRAGAGDKISVDENERNLRERERRKLRKIEERIEESKKGQPGRHTYLRFVSETDRILAGQAIDILVREAKNKNVSIAEIREKYDKLHRYKLSADVDVNDSKARKAAARKLLQRVENYLKIAEIIAGHSGRDIEDAKISVLKRTSLWMKPETSSPDVPIHEEAAELTFRLEQMAAFVIKKTDLAGFFERARRVPGVWDIQNSTFRPSTMACLFQSAYEGWNEHWEEAPPLPSVPLVRLLHTQIPATIKIDPREIAELDQRGDHQSAIVGEAVEVLLTLWREIRLCIGPTVAPDHLGPMFETRAFAKVAFGCEDQPPNAWSWAEIRPSCDLGMVSEGKAEMLIGKTWRRFTLLSPIESDGAPDLAAALSGKSTDDPWFWDFTPLDENKNCFEHWYLSWTPVNRAYVTHWLDKPTNFAAQIVAPSGEISSAGREPLFPKSNLAFGVDDALVTGGLEDALIREIYRLKMALDQREREWREGYGEATENLMARWGEDQPHDA